MPVQLAGAPRKESLAETVVGASKDLIIPISGDPNERWVPLFKGELNRNVGQVVRSAYFDAMLDLTSVGPTEIRTKLVDPEETRIYLDIVREAISAANQQEEIDRRAMQDAAARAQKEAAQADEVTDRELAAWTAANNSAWT